VSLEGNVLLNPVCRGRQYRHTTEPSVHTIV